MSTWEILPEGELRTDTTISVVSEDNSQELSVQGLDASLGVSQTKFTVPFTPYNNQQQYIATFSVSLPGIYRLQSGEFQKTIHVKPFERLNFATEFGLFSFVVILIVGGMVLWLKTKKNLSKKNA